MSQGLRDFLRRIKFWFGAIRAPFFIAVITPTFLGTAIAWASFDTFNWGYFLLVLLGVVCINGGANLLNDYYDHKSSNDEINVEYVFPFTGGSRMIQMGLLTPAKVLKVGLLFFAVAIAIGAYLTWATWASGPMILVLGAIGVFSGLFYTMPPFKLGYRWVGEIIVGLNCGVLVTLGAFWVQAQSFAWQPLIASIPLGLLIAAVLWINEIPDWAADKAVGKNQMVARIGKERAAKWYLVLVSVAYVFIVIGVILGGVAQWGLPLLALLGLLSFPIALKAMRTARANYADSKSLAPANASTPMIYLATGLLVTVGFLLDKLV